MRYEARQAQLQSAGEHLPSKGGTVYASAPMRRGRKYVVIGSTESRGLAYADPAVSVAWRIRHALNPRHATAPVTIYDASGKAIATMDPLTRVRTPLSADRSPEGTTPA